MTVPPVDIQYRGALAYITYGWHVAPLCHPDLKGRCSCGRRHQGNNIGKAPLTEHGITDSSIDPAIVQRWWSRWPNANIAIDLKRSGLLVIAPDSIEWLEEFKKRGLGNPLCIAQSGGGEGHVHFYYIRPPGCPVYRINRPGAFDIQTEGYMVAPPSLHQSGRHYRWMM